MKKYLYILLATLCLASCKPSQGNQDKFTGSWKMEVPQGTIVESWEKDGAGLKGKAVFIMGSDTIPQETMKLVTVNDTLQYIVQVQGKGVTEVFKEIERSENGYVFGTYQKTGSFPQRIRYNFVSNDSINACIAGINGNKYDSIPFTFTRVK